MARPFGLPLVAKAWCVIVGGLLSAPLASHAQSFGPPPPAVVFIVPGNAATVTQTTARVMESMGYAPARSGGLLTTAAKPPTTCGDDVAQVRITASVLPVSPATSVVVLWGVLNSRSAQGVEHDEYIIQDHADLPSYGCGWVALNDIRTSVIEALARSTENGKTHE